MKDKMAVIFGAGEYPDCCAFPEGAFEIAADGGWKEAKRMGRHPQAVLGDFDSLGYVPQGEGLKVYPKEKDDTDMMLAVKLALEQGCGRLLVYGGLGGRQDHSFANYCTLLYAFRHGCERSALVGRQETVFGVGDRLCFPSSLRGTVSVFAFGGDCLLELKGLKYPFAGVLREEFPLGVSNELTGEPAEIRVKQGFALVFWKGESRQILQLLEREDV